MLPTPTKDQHVLACRLRAGDLVVLTLIHSGVMLEGCVVSFVIIVSPWHIDKVCLVISSNCRFVFCWRWIHVLKCWAHSCTHVYRFKWHTDNLHHGYGCDHRLWMFCMWACLNIVRVCFHFAISQVLLGRCQLPCSLRTFSEPVSKAMDLPGTLVCLMWGLDIACVVKER